MIFSHNTYRARGKYNLLDRIDLDIMHAAQHFKFRIKIQFKKVPKYSIIIM